MLGPQKHCKRKKIVNWFLSKLKIFVYWNAASRKLIGKPQTQKYTHIYAYIWLMGICVSACINSKRINTKNNKIYKQIL